ncbi:MAG: 2-oxo-4-hydroxy-4-carboxy-5-ureidoimidazoline decarboxylase [Bacteriovoracia bacterium]
MNLKRINQFSPEMARAEFLRCCGSKAWAAAMVAKRPFENETALMQAADETWNALEPGDWLEAFAAHPKIGEKSRHKEHQNTKDLSEKEQAGVANAAERTLQLLETYNRDYESKYGFIFIVCATGKTGEEMLELIRTRIANDPAKELRVAAAEQSKITQLRLQKI